MKRKNLLTLHEAMVIALININKENYQATFEEIADYIKKKKLFEVRKDNIELAKQVELRSIQSKGRYKYLFEQIDKMTIKLNIKPKSLIK